jgi:hypothetical protein
VPCVRPQGFDHQRRRSSHFGARRVLGHVAHLVDLYPLGILERAPELIGQDRGFDIAGRKRLYESGQFLLGCVGEKVNAGEARGRQELREAALRRAGFDGRPVQDELRAGCAKDQSGLVAFENGSAEIGPGAPELLGRARVVEAVQADELQQDIETADKRAGRRQFGIGLHAGCKTRLSSQPIELTLPPDKPQWHFQVVLLIVNWQGPSGRVAAAACPAGNASL